MLKSFLVTQCLTAWFVGHNAERNVMIVSHTQSLSVKQLEGVRKIMNLPRYRELFPGLTLIKDTAGEIVTSASGGAFAASFEAAPTGRGCDLMVIDDPLKADDAFNPGALENCAKFFRQSLLSRLTLPSEGSVILVMQRLAYKDLSGELLQRGDFEGLSLPLIADEREEISYSHGRVFKRNPGDSLHPDRFPLAAISQMRSSILDDDFDAQYQQRPNEANSALLKEAWLRTSGRILNPLAVLQSWDTASSISERACYSVCTTWEVFADKCVLIHVFRQRLQAEQLREEATRLAKHYTPNVVLVEDSAAVFVVTDGVKDAGIACEVEHVRVRPSKRARLESCVTLFRDERVVLLDAPGWRTAYDAELLRFPNDQFDDQVDSTTLALNWVVEQWKKPDGLSRFKRPAFHIARSVEGGGPKTYRVGRGIWTARNAGNLRPGSGGGTRSRLR